MSYDIYLKNPKTGKTLQLKEPHDLKGGTYAVGGIQDCWLNITYNYSKHYSRIFGEKGIRTIYGMTGAKSIPILESAIAKLKDNICDNYWEPTEGNAKEALKNLLILAKKFPRGIFDGD
jgi:hypothetical protein